MTVGADLRVTVRFLQPYSHGRGEDGRPEWPPSPLRMFQALVASSVGRVVDPDARARSVAALAWLENQSPPEIVAPVAVETTAPYRLFVPDNIGDKVAKAWSAGRAADMSGYRTEKDVISVRLDGEAVHYVFRNVSEVAPHLSTLRAAARSMTHLGWGIDMVAGDAAADVEGVEGERWIPGKQGGKALRCATAGTLVALENKHAQFLHRLDGGMFHPVSPLTTFAVHPYARATDLSPRPHAAFRLLAPDTDRRLVCDPPRRARDVAAWLRHAVAEACTGWPYGSTGSLVHGHGGDPADARRARFSYLPLPTISRFRVDGALRSRVEGIARVIVVATPGLHAEMAWVKAYLAGRELVWNGNPVGLLDPLPMNDWVLGEYLASMHCWSTVTPVVFPGHDDRSGKKAERLLRKAFLQAGFEPEVVEGIQELEWRQEGFRTGVELANRYLPPDKVSGPLFHVRIRFATSVTGPIAIGSGRHRGMGVFAAVRS